MWLARAPPQRAEASTSRRLHFRLLPPCANNTGSLHRHLQVKPGPDGYRQFTEAIRRAFNLPDDSELNITFTCDEPSTGQHIGLGPGACALGKRALRPGLACPALQLQPVLAGLPGAGPPANLP